MRSVLGAIAGASVIVVIGALPAAAAPTVPDKAWRGAPGVTGEQCIQTSGGLSDLPAGCREVLGNLVKDGWVYNGGAIDRVISGDGRTTYSQFLNIFRYNAVTGAVDTSWTPKFFNDPAVPERGVVRNIVPGPDGSLLISGDFRSGIDLAGTQKTLNGLAKLRADGTFDPAFTNPIICPGLSTDPCQNYALDYSATHNAVLVGGRINKTTTSGANGLVILDGTTGAVLRNSRLNASAPLRGAVPYVRNIDVNPVNDSEFFLTGEFTKAGVNGGTQTDHYGMVKMYLDSARTLRLTDWNAIPALRATRPIRNGGSCSGDKFWSRDIEYTEDGRYIGIVSTAAGYPDVYPALCDAFSMFEAQPTGPGGTYDPNLKPTVYNRSPIDTINTLCFLGDTAYIGGHFRGMDHVVYNALGQRIHIMSWVASSWYPPNMQEELGHAHYGLAAMDISAGNPNRGMSVSSWNYTDLMPDSTNPQRVFPWEATPATTTGRGYGWSASSCVPAAQSPTGKDMVVFGGDAKVVNGDYSRQKIAHFNAP